MYIATSIFAGRNMWCMRSILLAGICVIARCLTGCAGPDRGWIAEARGRTQARFDALDADHAPRGASSLLEPVQAPLFPLLFLELGEVGGTTELLWPLFETGRGPELPWGQPRWFRFRPFFYRDSFRGYSRTVLFPFYFHIREELEAGNRSIDHLWPLYGIHREWIDLAPAVTHHCAWPLFFVRTGIGKWKVHLFPAFDASSGYIDRGWWLLPFLKVGSFGRSEHFYLLDPLFAYERDSIAESEASETPEKVRTSFRILGGLLGWENDRGKKAVRILWWIRV